MSKERVLFVCIHNSARSQMAEELLRKLGGERFEVESAGIDPGQLNPYVVRVLKEDEGIDISGKRTRAVQSLLATGKEYDYVVTVCDETSAERCPAFPGQAKRLHWGFPDPSQFAGTEPVKLEKVKEVKEEIKKKIGEWLGNRL